MEKANFWGINWGPDDAKGDDGLLNYFVKVPGFDDLLRGRMRYVIGRKGTGKTALLERIRLNSEDDPLIFAEALSLKNFPLSLVRDLRDKSHRDKAQFVPVWTFVLATAFAHLVLEDNGAGPADLITELREFINSNFPREGYNIAETVSLLKQRASKIQVNASWVAGEASRSHQHQLTSSVHYQDATKALLRRLKLVQTRSKYYILMDELDEGYRAGDQSLRLILLALLRATENIALELQAVRGTFLPVLALRSDIFGHLEDNDLNKLDDYIVRLNWRSFGGAERSLRDVVNARAEASIGEYPTQDYWNILVNNLDSNLPRGVKDVWVYMLNRTLERPRDILKYLKVCQRKHGSGLLDFATVKQAEALYSDWLYKELRDELHSFLPVWKDALNCITRIGRGKFSVQRYVDELQRDQSVRHWLEHEGGTTDTIIKTLFDYGVLGNLTRSKIWLFKYKDDDLAWNPEMTLLVHFGFHRKLRIFDRSVSDRNFYANN